VETAGQVYELSGKLKAEDRSVYRYKLVFSIAGNQMTGYSITDEGTEGEHRASLKGAIDTVSHTLSFREEGPVQCPGSCGGHCLFSGWGGFSIDSGSMVFMGEVLGRPAGFSDDGVACTRGWLSMKAGKSLKGLVKPKPVVAPPGTKDTKDTLLLTSSSPLQLEWTGRQMYISLADDKEADGDYLSLRVNGKVLVSALELTPEPYDAQARLRPGKNTLIIKAENDGALPPNTARIVLSGDHRQYMLHSVISAPKEAVIEITVLP
jgi:hypothetical protein